APAGATAAPAPDQPPPAPEAVPSLEPPPPLPEMPTLPDAPAPPARRMKSLRISTGAAPTAVDLGSEVAINEVGRGESYSPEETADQVNKGWWYSLKGYVRVPMRLSLGPKD